MRIAIQGAPHSFHAIAAAKWFEDDISLVSCDTFSDTFGALNRHDADAAVVAIENSLYGSINEVYDLIESHGYPIVGEYHLPIHQQLVARSVPGEITHIYSHPVALAQCAQFLDTYFPNAERVEFHDTAAAAAFVAGAKNHTYAAIASREAAEAHQLQIVRENIEDNPANFTRFLIVQPHGTAPIDANRTSLVLTTNNTPGSLASVLTVLANAGINLSKLQSRPIVGTPWKYRFYLVLDTAGEPLHAALSDLKPFVSSCTVLGEYRHHEA